jgi:UDP-N-acetylglucosamine--N-acetylmuramyl-(pentapeptide) pyrophosphoryl-undecaprenol N-acetylglucosamine transferase
VKTICYVAGHSGGHIIPCLTLAQQDKKLARRVIFFATDTHLDRTVIGTHAAIDALHLLTLEQVPYTKPWRLPIFAYKCVRAVITTWRILRRERPEKLVTTGGFIAIPVCVAARIAHIPVELFELNVTPGKTISLLAPMAHKISTVFARTQTYFPKKECTVTAYPIRFTHAAQGNNALPSHFSPTRKTVLVLGGSQGSQALNEHITQWVAHYPEFHQQLQIVHQIGKQELVQKQELYYQKLGIPAVVFSFSDNLAPWYQIADLVLARAGSGTLAELRYFGCRSIIIPLETKLTDHQLHNAHALQQELPHLFTVLRQQEVAANPAILAAAIAPIFQTSEPQTDHGSAVEKHQ